MVPTLAGAIAVTAVVAVIVALVDLRSSVGRADARLARQSASIKALSRQEQAASQQISGLANRLGAL
jgi:hypothetical protein